MKWSSYQKAIFKWCRDGKGSAIVQAVAGSGKTTTIVKAIEFLEGSTLFLAFNKSIANTLLDKNVNAKTFHGVCFSAVRKGLEIKNVDADKLHKIIKENLDYDARKLYQNAIKRLVGLAKQSGVGILCGDDEFQRLFNDHDIELDSIQGNLPDFFRYTKLIFEASIRDRRSIDFDDMLYLTVKHDIPLERYDNILVDESQDTNAIQRAILKKLMKSKSRLIAVGDKNQAIYRFRGADSNSMDLIKNEFNCIELPLTVSYRCGSEIVNYARKYSSYIEPAPNAHKGSVTVLDKFDVSTLKKQDYVICRVTRPLISMAYKCMNQRIPVTVLGRDIGKNLKTLINKCTGTTIDDLIVNLEAYRAIEINKLVKLEQESKIETINDKVDTILSLCDSLPISNRTVEELHNVIDTLFSEKKNAVIFSTIHKAKGLESNRVFWLNYHQCPPKWAKKPEDVQQEINICYVAVTRAKEALYLVKEGSYENNDSNNNVIAVTRNKSR